MWWEGVNWLTSGSGLQPVAGPRDHGNEPLGSVKGGEFLV
jgi:hypothetical protein